MVVKTVKCNLTDNGRYPEAAAVPTNGVGRKIFRGRATDKKSKK